uniref:Pol polyprotein n=1 Tax=Cajanus cajan TaxID=3821 RepID=A0A151SWP9_CAJCA|nr:Pol polyprotein [Cajanus cajan]
MDELKEEDVIEISECSKHLNTFKETPPSDANHEELKGDNTLVSTKPELKILPIHLNYVFLQPNGEKPIIISNSMSQLEEEKLIKVLQVLKEVIGWSISNLKGINPAYYMHKINMKSDYRPVAQPQRRLNPIMKEEVRKEVLKLLEAGMIYPISDSEWLIPTRTVTGWRICIDYRKVKLESADANLLYQPSTLMIEKLVLALVTVARHLRPYFQSHQVIVKTDYPIKQILRKPELAGRMIAWSVELSEFGIQYESRGALKAQCLAEFVVELMPTSANEPQVWTLHVDGSSNSKSGGAGIILEGPNHVTLEQSLKFNFKVTNNQAEYEALLAGLRLARDLGARKLSYNSDSKLMRVVSPAKGLLKFLLVAVDYFTKWIEACPLAKITMENIRKFTWKNIICRIGIPHSLVTDNGRQFIAQSFEDFLRELGIKHLSTSVEHPQTNGQAESANKVILRELKKRLGNVKGQWADKLPSILWHTNAPETPYRLTYGADAMIPMEIGETSHRRQVFNSEQNAQELAADLDLIDELRDETQIHEEACKLRASRRYNTRVRPRSFRVGDLVWRLLGKARRDASDGKLAPN